MVRYLSIDPRGQCLTLFTCCPNIRITFNRRVSLQCFFPMNNNMLLAKLLNWAFCDNKDVAPGELLNASVSLDHKAQVDAIFNQVIADEIYDKRRFSQEICCTQGSSTCFLRASNLAARSSVGGTLPSRFGRGTGRTESGSRRWRCTPGRFLGTAESSNKSLSRIINKMLSSPEEFESTNYL